MKDKGLVKLVEELNELGTVAAKKIAYMDMDEHPDGKGSLQQRIQEEMGDVLAAMRFVAVKLSINWARVEGRAREKQARFEKWDVEE